MKELKAKVKASAPDNADWPSLLITTTGEVSITTDMAIDGLVNGTYAVQDLEAHHLNGVLKEYIAIYGIDIVATFINLQLPDRHNCKPKAFLILFFIDISLIVNNFIGL